ncbi:hypothetical protein ACQP1W_38815 [Spirillospora sp. CA-255316]
MTGASGGPLAGSVSVAVGAHEHGWEYGRCSVVVTLGATGPLRVQYSMVEPSGPSWLRLVRVRGWRRRRVLAAALRCGALSGAGGAVDTTDGGPVDGGVALYGWLVVAAGDRMVRLRLPGDGRIGGVPMREMVLGLVPGRVWRELHARRDEAWIAWAERARGDVRVLSTEETVPDPSGFDADATVRDPSALDLGGPPSGTGGGGTETTLPEPGAVGPVGGEVGDRHVAGRNGPDGSHGRGGPAGPGGEGYPGIWHGGGRGGVW